jgi:uncharacterized membrane protein YfcA
VPASHVVLLVAAGVVAGVVGTAGGITSLISYPALILAGLPPLGANVANVVSLVACWPGSALASRPELAGRAAWLRRWSLATALAGAAGAGLLLATPPGAFADVVPALVAIAAIALLAAPRLARAHEHRAGALLLAGLVVAAAYNGYFGAGAGIMTLALILITVERHVARANALKNMLVGAATVTSALTLAVFAHVDWSAVAPLASGMFAGSTIGPRVARRIPGDLLRWVVGVFGLALAALLVVDPRL